MPLIAIMIPRGAGSGGGSMSMAMTPDRLPYVAGECAIEGYRNMILAEEVSWHTQIPEDPNHENRRTVHSPNIDCVRIVRDVDRATSRLTKMALGATVTAPWELYFLRVLGDDLLMEALAAAARSVGLMSSRVTRFMTMTLHEPLISKYEFSFDESRPRETLEVSAAAIEWTYYKAGSHQGTTGVKSVGYRHPRDGAVRRTLQHPAGPVAPHAVPAAFTAGNPVGRLCPGGQSVPRHLRTDPSRPPQQQLSRSRTWWANRPP